MIRMLLLLAIFYTPYLYGQTISGTVKSKYGSVVPDIWVSSIGRGKIMTNKHGEFELDISTCNNCKPGNLITFIVYNKEYGCHRIIKTINTNYNTFIEIKKNPNIVTIIGTVQDVKSKKFIKGIKVKLLSIPGISDREIQTDKYGVFEINVEKEKIENNKYVELVFTDTLSIYPDRKATKNISSPFEIELKKKPEKFEYNINSEIITSVRVSPGDTILVKATGSIKVGQFVGHSDPEGRSGGVFGLDISNYNLVKQFNHAALMYRITGDNEWFYAGKGIEFCAKKEGYLEFEVNDRIKTDNYGTYQVKITKK